jgi:hypothetical protein
MKITFQVKPLISDVDSVLSQDLLKAEKKEFFEIKQIDSQQQKVMCLHQVLGVS